MSPFVMVSFREVVDLFVISHASINFVVLSPPRRTKHPVFGVGFVVPIPANEQKSNIMTTPSKTQGPSPASSAWADSLAQDDKSM